MGRYTHYSYLGVSFWGCASLFEGGRRRIGGFCNVERKSWFRSVVDIYEGVLVFCRELPFLHACHRSRLLHANVPTQHEQQYENDWVSIVDASPCVDA